VVQIRHVLPAFCCVMPAKAGTQSLPLAGAGGRKHRACGPWTPSPDGRLSRAVPGIAGVTNGPEAVPDVRTLPLAWSLRGVRDEVASIACRQDQ
jgi:hypothetical protein